MRTDAADTVRVLVPRERVEEDLEPIVSIYRNLGSDSGASVVQRALSDLGLALAVLADRMSRRQPAEVRPALRRVEGMANGLGFVTLVAVCGDLDRCVERGDATASAAVWARLCRVAELALGMEACGGDGAR
ncbi:MAG: hypothetical protein RIR62_706 [Pseudomonadota bacterium]|jgi:hypothetical protein